MILKCNKCDASHQQRVGSDFKYTTCPRCSFVGNWTTMFFHENASRGVNLYRTTRSRRGAPELWALKGHVGQRFVRHHADAIGEQGSLL